MSEYVMNDLKKRVFFFKKYANFSHIYNTIYLVFPIGTILDPRHQLHS